MLSIGSFDAFLCKKKQGHCPAPHHHPWHPVTAVEMAGVLLLASVLVETAAWLLGGYLLFSMLFVRQGWNACNYTTLIMNSFISKQDIQMLDSCKDLADMMIV